jgi:hypothetical protein
MITMKSNELTEKLESCIENNLPFKIEASRSYHGRYGTYNSFFAVFIKEAKNGKPYRSVETLDSRSKKKVNKFLKAKGFDIKCDYDCTNWKFTYWGI